MRIYNKTDYEKTLENMPVNGKWEVRRIGDIQPIRSQVSKISKKLRDAGRLPAGARFHVSKNEKGATVERTA